MDYLVIFLVGSGIVAWAMLLWRCLELVLRSWLRRRSELRCSLCGLPPIGGPWCSRSPDCPELNPQPASQPKKMYGVILKRPPKPSAPSSEAGAGKNGE